MNFLQHGNMKNCVYGWKKQMKVLEILNIFGNGAIGRIAASCYSVLKKNGDECIIAYGRGRPFDGLETYKIGNAIGIYSHVAITRLFDACGYGSVFATRKLLRFIDEFKPDVLHLHILHGYYINIFELFSYIKAHNIPVVWTLHDCWSFTGHCPYYSVQRCEKWKTLCHDCPQVHKHPKSIFFDFSSRNYKAKKECFTGVKNMIIVTPSQWLANQVKDSFLKDYRVEVIHNGIDQSVFRPHETDILRKYKCERKKVVLGVANVWGFWKGFDVFIKLSRVLNPSYQLIMVGLNEKQIHGLPGNIIGIAHTESVSELSDLYSAASVFLNPTRCDNFPTTNIEALSCGTPVITFEGTGSPEALDEASGVIVKQDDYEGVLNAIYQLCSKPKNSAAVLNRAKIFGENYAYSQYISLFDEIIKNS